MTIHSFRGKGASRAVACRKQMKRVCPLCGRARRKVAPSTVAFLSGKYPSCNATNDEKEKNSKRIAYFVHGENKKGGEYRRILVIFCEKSKGSCVFVKCGVPHRANRGDG